MDKKTLDALIAKKSKKESRTISVRIPLKTYELLKKKNVDIAQTVKNVLERLAD